VHPSTACITLERHDFGLIIPSCDDRVDLWIAVRRKVLLSSRGNGILYVPLIFASLPGPVVIALPSPKKALDACQTR